MSNLVDVANLIQICQKIEGRVKLQKIVHILKEAGHPFIEEFGYLHHGPYSSDLKREIDQLVDLNMITEEEEQSGKYKQYTYSPSDQLATILNDIGYISDLPWKSLATNLNSKSSQELEGISTIMFLRRRGFKSHRLSDRFNQLKPHLIDRFDNCLSQAQEFQLLTL